MFYIYIPLISHVSHVILFHVSKGCILPGIPRLEEKVTCDLSLGAHAAAEFPLSKAWGSGLGRRNRRVGPSKSEVFSYCGWLRNPAPPKGWLKHVETL